MKYSLYSAGLVAIVLLLTVLGGCTPRIFGVPEPQWAQMTEVQRQTVISGYNERELVREKRWSYEAQQRARNAEIAALEAQRQEVLRQQNVDAIYAGYGGQYGDLIQISIQGGTARLGGKQRDYKPIAIKLANGEVKKVQLQARRHHYQQALILSYHDGLLMVDTDNNKCDGARMVFDGKWRLGRNYSVNTDGPIKLHNARVYVQIIAPRQ